MLLRRECGSAASTSFAVGEGVHLMLALIPAENFFGFDLNISLFRTKLARPRHMVHTDFGVLLSQEPLARRAALRPHSPLLPLSHTLTSLAAHPDHSSWPALEDPSQAAPSCLAAVRA